MAGIPHNIYKIKAIVILRESGFTWYQICKAINQKDKRNLIYYYNRYREKYVPEFKELIKKVGNNQNPNY